ncbi:hypothetical protein [Inquilinus limosus]|uniref:hypothetical protein n=1 Tax=Inquilinus limosus TaxID=171674 RepID=UPI000B4898CA|nr:hypothetical protein [Inquilinus limosus]
MTHRPDHALERLLDALEAELAAASEDEIRQAAAETRRKVSYAASDVRGVIRRAGAVDGLSPGTSVTPAGRTGLSPHRWH